MKELSYDKIKYNIIEMSVILERFPDYYFFLYDQKLIIGEQQFHHVKNVFDLLRSYYVSCLPEPEAGLDASHVHTLSRLQHGQIYL